MSDELAQREMTLAEWVGKLYEGHTARVELAVLERELAEAREEIERLNSPVLKSEWQQMESALAALRQRHTDTEGLLTHWQNRYAALEAKWDALREQHYNDIRAAFQQGMLAAEAICDDYGELPLGSVDEAWEASKWARREP